MEARPRRPARGIKRLRRIVHRQFLPVQYQAMKNFAIIVAVFLLSSVLLVEGQRLADKIFPGGKLPPGQRIPPSGGSGRRCGNQVCPPGRRCVTRPLRCLRPPCASQSRCL
ncbi:uncharacterized protein LOC144097175 [Amblyomma americanum]